MHGKGDLLEAARCEICRESSGVGSRYHDSFSWVRKLTAGTQKRNTSLSGKCRLSAQLRRALEELSKGPSQAKTRLTCCFQDELLTIEPAIRVGLRREEAEEGLVTW